MNAWSSHGVQYDGGNKLKDRDFMKVEEAKQTGSNCAKFVKPITLNVDQVKLKEKLKNNKGETHYSQTLIKLIGFILRSLVTFLQ